MRRRWLLGSISGFGFGLFLALDLLFFGVLALDSDWLGYLPIAGLVAGLALALWAPRGRPGDAAAEAPSDAAPEELA
jgi:hypothetical protein